MYLKILIEDEKNYKKAAIFIREKIQLDEKIRYIKYFIICLFTYFKTNILLREFGQVMMKMEPKDTLELLKNLVNLA